MHGRKQAMDGAGPAVHGSLRLERIQMDSAAARAHSRRRAQEGGQARHTARRRGTGALDMSGVRTNSAGETARIHMQDVRAGREQGPRPGSGRGGCGAPRGGSGAHQGARARSAAVVLGGKQVTRRGRTPRGGYAAHVVDASGRGRHHTCGLRELWEKFWDTMRTHGGELVAYRAGAWMVEPRRTWVGLTVQEIALAGAVVALAFLGIRALAWVAWTIHVLTGWSGF